MPFAPSLAMPLAPILAMPFNPVPLHFTAVSRPCHRVLEPLLSQQLA
jgi:hypothetical protein